MTRDMSNIYRFMPLDQLKTLKREKQYQLNKLRQAPMYYAAMQEVRRVNHLLQQLDREIQCRLDQMDLW